MSEVSDARDTSDATGAPPLEPTEVPAVGEPQGVDDQTTTEGEELGQLRARNAQLEQQLAHKHTFWSVTRGSTGRRIISTVLVLVSLILAPVSVITVWTKNTITDENQYVATMTPLASNPDIQAAVTNRVTTLVYNKLDVPKVIHQSLPPSAVALAGPLSSAVKGFISTVVGRVVASSAFQRTWVAANRAAHRQVVGALEGTSNGGLQVKNGEVQLNLNALLTTVQQRLVSDGLTAAKNLPVGRINATITLFKSAELQRYQRWFQVLQVAGDWLPVAVILILALGIWLARDRRRSLIAVGVFVALGMVLLEIGLAVVRSFYLSHLPSTVESPAAAAAAFDILVRFLKDSAWAMFTLGLAVALVAYLAGPSIPARTARRVSTTGMGHVGDSMEARGWLPAGLRTFFSSTRRVWEVGLIVAAGVSLILWRGRTVLGIILTALLLLLVLLLVEGLGRRDPEAIEARRQALVVHPTDGAVPSTSGLGGRP